MTMMPIGNRFQPRASSLEQWGQVTIEYFILFAVVALLTVAGLTTFDDDVRQHMQELFTTAADAITR